MLWEDVEERQRLPTTANILQGLRWLLSDLQPGYSLVFHYSGGLLDGMLVQADRYSGALRGWR